MRKILDCDLHLIKALASFIFTVVFALNGYGANFIVNSNGDSRDLTPGDGTCADSEGICTLRAAVEESNASNAAGGNNIIFASNNPGTVNLTIGSLVLSADVTITGPGARRLIVQRSSASGTASFRIFSVIRFNNSTFPTVNANISGLTVANGESSSLGAGLFVCSNCIVNLAEVVVRNNTAIDSPGGGILVSGNLNITRSLITGNTASQGAGLSNQPGSVTTIENSTISDNSAIGSPVNNVSGSGGAITNFTRLTLNNVTVANNTSTVFNGGITATTGTTTYIRNSIIANNTSQINPDAAGPITSLGNNLIGNNNGSGTAFPVGNPNANGDRVGTGGATLNPQIGNLQNNGGQTDTRSLLTGSLAINSGNNCVADRTCGTENPQNPLVFDQRGNGFIRRFGSSVDIGAYENQPAQPISSRLFDFDGDGKSDISVFRPENGSWYIQQSQNGFTGLAFGLSTDKLVPVDYDGDGKTDVAVVRNGNWYLQRSSLGFTGIQFGDSNDIPVPADYDGDGKAELAMFRPSNGYWYLLNLTTNQFTATPFGQNGDKPVAADYDGDGKTDIAVNRNGNWYIQRTQLGFTGVQFGDATDKTVPADYDGDGKTDVAVFRPSNGTWYLLQSTAGFAGLAFGLGTDIPVAADYDGDGKADVAVVRNGNWYLNRSTNGFTGILFGTASDLPIPNAFVR